MKITSYLIFNGEAEDAANFYADALSGRIENLSRYNRIPPMKGMPPIDELNADLIMHCCINFEGGSISVADTLPNDPRDFGNCGHMLTLSCSSAAQAEAVWAKLNAGAIAINCPLGETFYAKLYGEVIDKFDVLWAVMYEEA